MLVSFCISDERERAFQFGCSVWYSINLLHLWKRSLGFWNSHVSFRLTIHSSTGHLFQTTLIFSFLFKNLSWLKRGHCSKDSSLQYKISKWHLNDSGIPVVWKWLCEIYKHSCLAIGWVTLLKVHKYLHFNIMHAGMWRASNYTSRETSQIFCFWILFHAITMHISWGQRASKHLSEEYFEQSLWTTQHLWSCN